MYKKYAVNEEFFKTWNEASAYVLGWLLTDGCIQYIPQKKYSIRFELADLEAVETIKSVMGSNHPIRERQDRANTLYLLVIDSKPLIKQLLDLGVAPAKTKRLVLPEIPDKYTQHLIRGIFDGDGSVFIRKEPNPQLGSYICSTSKQFLEQIGKILLEKIDLIPKIYEDKPGFYKLRYGGKESHALYKYLYSDSNFYLTRKKLKFEDGIDIKAGIGLASCKRCGKEIVRTSSSTKWCSDCKIIVRQGQWRQSGEHKKARRNQTV